MLDATTDRLAGELVARDVPVELAYQTAERAAILEYDVGLPRRMAESLAQVKTLGRVVVA